MASTATAAAASAAQSPAGGAPSAAGSNPFPFASNWYFEPNSQEIAQGSLTLTSSPKTFSIQLNSNGFLRDYRCVVRSSGGVGGTPTPDNPGSLFKSVTFQTSSGAEFFQDMSGYNHILANAFGRPWEGDPTQAYDYARSINPSMTFKLCPELRYTAGALPNMDDRRAYKVQGYIGSVGDVVSGTSTTAPTVTFASGVDTWAQPDSMDLMKVPNEQVPGGVTMQVFRRHATQTLNGAGSNNTIDARSLTGNLQRLIMLIVRDSNNVRQDYLSNPLTWLMDTRTMSNYQLAALFGQMYDFYGNTVMPRPTGVYVFPRFFNPGSLVGGSWLETSGATKELWQSTTVSSATNTPGTIEIFVEDIVPGGPIPVELTNL